MQQPYNISLYPGTGSADGRRGDHIIIAPAYTITSDEIRFIVDTVERVIVRFFNNHMASASSTEVKLGSAAVSLKTAADREAEILQVVHKPRR